MAFAAMKDDEGPIATVLGLVVILTTATFGAINSTIWFNVGIAVLFVVLALAMFDVIAIDPDDRGALYQLGRTAVFSGTNLERAIVTPAGVLAVPDEGDPAQAPR